MNPQPTPLPRRMQALELNDYQGVAALRLVEKPVPEPQPGQLLVKMHAAPINPSDLLFLSGRYGQRKALPVVPGFEGSGVVVAAGSPLLRRLYLGRKVACGAAAAGDGTWAEYMCVAATACMPLRSLDLEQGAMMLVNPLTAYLMLAQAKRQGHRAVIHSAAASSLGKMLLRLGLAKQMPIIHVVRRDAQVAELRALGAQYVLNSSHADFVAQLQEHSHNLRATLALDAVGGHLGGQLLEAMPPGSTLRSYGALAEEALQLDPRALIFAHKHIDGFWLADAFRPALAPALLRAVWQLPQLVEQHLYSTVQARYRLADFQEALEHYQQHMSDGKVLWQLA